MSTFAVVTVLHDSEDDLARLLASLDHSDPAPTRIVAVDAGSADGGPDLARAHGCEVVDAGDVGFGGANNAGLALVREPVTVLLNPDIVVSDPGALGALAELAGVRDALHAPRLLNPDGTVQDSAHRLPGNAGPVALALLPEALTRPPWRATATREVGWAIAAALCARTDTLRALGPFDPAQFMFFEDLDLCLRAHARGLPTILHPEIALTHSGGHSTRAAYGGEPHGLLARRRREVVGANLGARALLLDDVAQGLTFALRAPFKRRPRAQLGALRRARADARRGGG